MLEIQTLRSKNFGLEYIRSHDRVWFTTGKEMCGQWLQSGATF
jgi:hypothetical protein